MDGLVHPKLTWGLPSLSWPLKAPGYLGRGLPLVSLLMAVSHRNDNRHTTERWGTTRKWESQEEQISLTASTLPHSQNHQLQRGIGWKTVVASLLDHPCRPTCLPYQMPAVDLRKLLSAHANINLLNTACELLPLPASVQLTYFSELLQAKPTNDSDMKHYGRYY